MHTNPHIPPPRLQYYLWDKNLIAEYFNTRNGMLGGDYSTKFSPWLAAGCLSPRTIYHAIRKYEAQRVANKSTYWVIFELIWRDFFRWAAGLVVREEAEGLADACWPAELWRRRAGGRLITSQTEKDVCAGCTWRQRPLLLCLTPLCAVLSSGVSCDDARRFYALKHCNAVPCTCCHQVCCMLRGRFYALKHGNSIFFAEGPAGTPLAWSRDEELWQRWRDGRTGLPLVDANMRELAATGFMSNRWVEAGGVAGVSLTAGRWWVGRR